MNLLYQRADCRISGGGLKLGLGLVGAASHHPHQHPQAGTAQIPTSVYARITQTLYLCQSDQGYINY